MVLSCNTFYQLKNLPEDINVKITKNNNLKLVNSILEEANVDGNVVIKVERHPPESQVEKASIEGR